MKKRQKLINTPYTQKEIDARSSDNICWDCGHPFLCGGPQSEFNVVTSNTGICGLCHCEKTVTNYRNWNWLKINERIRGNLYGRLVKRRKDANCKHCNEPVYKGDIAFAVDQRTGYKNIFVGILHVPCFDLFGIIKKPETREHET